MMRTVPCFAPHEAVRDADALLLAAVPGASWGLYVLASADAECDGVERVPDSLRALIVSGTRYPPALALAREEVDEVLGGQPAGRAELVTAYSAAVEAYLARQHRAAFVLAPSIGDGEDGRRRGEWSWVLQVGGTPPGVVWVSADYRIRDAPADAFDLTGSQLRALASM